MSSYTQHLIFPMIKKAMEKEDLERKTLKNMKGIV